MKKFRVLVREIHVCEMFVEAESPEAAVLAVRNGDGDIGDTSYDYTPSDGEAVFQPFEVEDA